MTNINKIPIQDEEALLARRNLLKCGFGALILGVTVGKAWAEKLPTTKDSQEISIENFSAAGKSQGVVKTTKVIKSDAEWRALLTFESFQVSRHSGTETPYTGKYWNSHAKGIYRCICCNTALFDSQTKFESGTGWPSFWQAISTFNLVKSEDNTLGMQRDAVSCHRCDGHLGHVFDDGPKPTGLRYCMNSVALRFISLT